MTAAAARLSGLRRDLPARAQVVRAFGVLAIGGVLALCGWIPFDLQPHPGLDQSWVGALHMAAHSDLAWGRDLVFTYGPLGFLRLPAYWYGDTGALAIAYWLVVRVTAFAALWLLARRAFGGVGAFVLLLLIVHELSEPLLPVAFAWGAWLLHRRPGPRAHTAFAVVVGAVGALELLAKVNNGVTILALGAVALLFVRADRWRWLLVFAGSALFALLAGWLVTGQPLSALPDYLLNSARVTSGYSAAMNTDGDRWQITAALVVFLLGAYGIWRIGEPGRARRGMLALWLLLAFTQYKAAFVRHDAPHVIQYFAVLLPALVALPWPRAMRPYALATSAAALLVLVGLRGEPVTEFTQPWHRVSAARHDLGSLNDRAAKRAAGVAEVRNDAGLTPATLAALNGRTVHVAPYEASVVWAYNLRWKPMPVFQSYQAYTRGLDEVNARALEKPSGPERILLGDQPPVDGRVPGWESPAAVTAMLCDYSPVAAQAGKWLVLARGANRCGGETPLGTVSAAWEQDVPVPPASAPGRMVLVRIHGADVSGLERLRSLFYKAHIRVVTLDGAAHRLVPGTAADGLLLRVPAAADYPAPFRQSPEVHVIRVAKEGEKAGGDKSLRLEFYERPVAPLRGG